MFPFNLPTASILGILIAIIGLFLLILGFGGQIKVYQLSIEFRRTSDQVPSPKPPDSEELKHQRNRRNFFSILGIPILILGIIVSLSPLWPFHPISISTGIVTPTIPSKLPTQTATPTPTASQGNIRLVQHEFSLRDDTTSTNPVTFSKPVTTNNLMIVAITQNAGTVASVVDTQHDVFYTAANAITATANNDYVELYYTNAVSGGDTTITVTFTATTDSNVGVYEYSGTAKESFDHATSASGMGTSLNGGTLTSIENGELYFVVGVDDDGANLTPTPGMGYTLEDHTDDANNERFYTEDHIAAQGDHKTDFSISTSSYWAIIAASFKTA